MAKLKLTALRLLAAILSMASTSSASTYMVGDTSGWDISSNFDSWTQGKVFKVGDSLVFMYSSSNNVCEVNKQSFDTCNTSNPLKTYSSNGNANVTLSSPGDKFFVSCNKLYCLGGMKLRVHVDGDEPAASPSPIESPRAQPSGTITGSNSKSLPVKPSSKSDDHTASSSVVPNSSSGICNHNGGSNSILVFFVGFLACNLLRMKQA